MGMDPDDPDYEAGDPCIACEDSLFGGVTPKYVWLHLQGMQACPLQTFFTPNGSFRLQKILGICEWRAFITGSHFAVWQISPVSRMVVQEQGTGLPHFRYINGLATCEDSFSNQQVVCGGINMSIGGTALITWGPDHPCGGI